LIGGFEAAAVVGCRLAVVRGDLGRLLALLGQVIVRDCGDVAKEFAHHDRVLLDELVHFVEAHVRFFAAEP